MTLILSAIAPRWAMQASDRKVSVVTPTGQVVGGWEERNKAVFVAERMTFAYTGHADLGGVDTADWFQGQVARGLGRGLSVEAALSEVGEMTGQYFRSLAPGTDRNHAFVGVGWTEGEVQDRSPFIVALSNSIGPDGQWREDPTDGFRMYRVTLGPHEPFSLVVAGAEVTPESVGRMNALIGSHVTQSEDAAPVARVLIDAIRAEADQNDSIGKGVMVNCLPVSPGPPTGEIMLIGGLPESDVRTFTYVPAGHFEGRYLGPLVVGSDGSQIGGYVAEGTSITAEGGSTGMSYRPATAPRPPRAAIGQRIREYRIGRNDPCWCGSGKKFKKCHAE